MADTSLTATTGSGTQSTTQSPQSSAAAGSTTATASNVQPGTSNSLLNNTSGVTLGGSQPTVVNLGAGDHSQTTFAQTKLPQSSVHRHFNPVLFGLPGVLFICAIGLFLFMKYSVKNTSKY